MNIKKLLSLFIILILVILIRNIGFSIYTQIKNEDTVNDLKTKLQEEKKEQAFLNQRLTEVQTDSFIEKQAREKLGLTRNNEYSVFAPPPTTNQNIEESYELPNWKKWREVFRL
jgi:cell division protein FtsB